MKKRGTKRRHVPSGWNDWMAVKSLSVVTEESTIQRFNRARWKKRNRHGECRREGEVIGCIRSTGIKGHSQG